MLKKNNIKELAVFFLIGGLYAWSLIANIISTTVLSADFFDIYLLTLGFLFLFLIVCYNKITLCVSLAFIMSIFLYLLYYAFLAENTPGHIESLYRYSYRLFMFIRGFGAYGDDYTYPIVIIITILITLYTTIFILISFNFPLMAGLGIILFAISWAMGYKSLESVYLVFLISSIVLFAKSLNLSGKKELNGQFPLMMIPLCVLLTAAAYYAPMPKNVDPPDISSLNEAIRKPYDFINSVIYEMFSPKYFSMQSSGFTGQDSRLGGKVRLSNEYVMSVYSDDRVYLTGAAKDTYTGYSWTNSDSDYYPSSADAYNYEAMLQLSDKNQIYSMIDNPEIIESFSYYDSEVGNDKSEDYPIKSVTVEIGAGGMGTIFKPLGIFNITMPEGYNIYVNNHGDVRTNKFLKKGMRYSIQYLDIDFENIAEDILKELSSNEEHSDFADNRENYKRIPDTVPDRVYELTKNITYEYDDDYSKIKAIESYLNSYKYSLSPEMPPMEADFVDYFLFEGQEGYCTYYASAMVIMSRIIGMPARYVEGYVMPNKKNEYGAYVVTNNQAHAWAEVYFEGFGWIAFEPTAPFAESFYDSQSEVDSYTGEIEFTGEEYEYYSDMGLTPWNNTAPSAEKTGEEKPQYESASSYARIIIIPLLSVAAAFLMVVIVNSVRRKLFNVNLRKLQRSDRVNEYFKKIVQIAGILGYPFDGNETVNSYGQRLGNVFSFKDDEYYMSDIVEIFSQVKYGGKEASEEEMGFIRDAYDEMIKKSYYILKKYKYVFYRYVLYKF